MLAIARYLLIFFAYQLAWHASALFEVHPFVSALYLGCGITFAVGLFYGWRYLPAVYLATVFAYYSSFSDSTDHLLNWAGALRQTLIYGVAGLTLRPLWKPESFRLSLPVAIRFLATALVASLLSAFAAMQMPPFHHLSFDERQAIFFSFWGGDFAGSMILVPMLIRLYESAIRQKGTIGLVDSLILWLKWHLRQDLLWFGLLGVAVASLAMLIPAWLGSEASLEMLALLPVLLAGLCRGAYMGFIVALLVSLVEIFVRPAIGLQSGLAVDVQLLIAMNVALALLAGAAHDDRQHEWNYANFDALTGLANHRQFIDRLQYEIARCERSGQRFGVLYLDLDGFKAVNDSLGHQAGDELLREIALRLKGGVRKTDVVARLSGDEFAILLPDAGEWETVERVAQSLLDRIEDPVETTQGSARVSASMGIVFFPTSGENVMSLMQAADRAMYKAKAEGKNRFSWHRPSSLHSAFG